MNVFRKVFKGIRYFDFSVLKLVIIIKVVD